MATTLTISRAREILLSRDMLLRSGCTERRLRSHVADGSVVRLRRDRYALAADLANLWPEGRHLIDVVAAHLNGRGSDPVFWGPSAAVLHGIPLYRLHPKNVHVAVLGSRHARTKAGVVQHDVLLPEGDITRIDGIRCTALDRTILDLACTATWEATVAAADAALRRECVTGHDHDERRAEQWHLRMSERARQSRLHGIRHARRLIAFADGRAQLPGESVSRLHLHRLGFRDVMLQVPITGAEGDRYWLDFGFPGSQVFGEFDGQTKYLDEDLRGGRTLEQALLDEKRREDDVRGVTGWRFARWEERHIRTADMLGQRLAAFGVHPQAR